MTIEIRTLAPDDLEAMLAVDEAAFSQPVGPAERDPVRATTEWDRFFGASVDGVLCGITGSYGVEVTVPGLIPVPTSGVTAVGVLPTHRRRGVLTALMAHQLEDSAARGEPFAILNASEATIYGRFGYGVASVVRTAEVRSARSTFVTPVADGLDLRLLTRAEATEVAPAWFEAYRRATPGEINRPATWWPSVFGEQETWKGGGPMFIVGCEPGDPEVPGGYAIYRVASGQRAGERRLNAREVIAADPEVRMALWRFLLDVDLVDFVVGEILVDDPLQWRLDDWRALSVQSESDYLWVRILDVAAALAARRYRAHDSLVIEVTDDRRPGVSGRFRVEGDRTGAACERVDGAPDLVMDVAALGSLYLGGTSASALSGSARVVGCTDGALERADLFFGSDRAPTCTTHF